MRAALALFALLSVSSLAQTPAVSRSFVIADVHTSPFTNNPFMHGNSIQGDRYFLTQATMVDLIATAYGVDAANVQGGPSWLELDRYDIRAKVPPGTTQADVKLMLRALLADRFHLVVKTGTAPMPAYILSAGPGKPKMTESDGTGEASCVPLPPPQNSPPGAPSYVTVSCKNLTMAAFADTLVAVKPKLKPTLDPTERTKCKEGPGPDGKDPRIASPVLNRLITCQNMTIAQIGDELQHVAGGYIYNPVVDGTGLKGSYDFTLSFSSADKVLPSAGDAANSSDPNSSNLNGSDPNGALSVFDAINRQLGLKLEKTKRPYPVLVIDHMDETPTPN